MGLPVSITCLVVIEVQCLQPLVAGEGPRGQVGDVVVGQVQLHHDLEVLERVGVDILCV